MHRSKCFLQPIFLVFFAFFLVSCAPKANQVSLNYDDQIEVDLSGGQLQAGFTYYYAGSEAEPHTIIGIAPHVSFQAGFWQPAQAGNEQVAGWLELIDNRHRDITDMYSGAKLVDGNGKQVGIWYSKYRFFSGHFSDNGQLIIRRPVRDKRGEIFGSTRK